MDPQNWHKAIPNSELHVPKDFSIAAENTELIKDANSDLTWSERFWLKPVIDLVDGSLPPPTESLGDRYLLIDISGTSVNSAWDGADHNDVVQFSDLTLDGTGDTWVNQTPQEAYTLSDKDTDNDYRFDGTDWFVKSSGNKEIYFITGEGMTVVFGEHITQTAVDSVKENFTFAVPLDYTSTVSLDLIVIPDATTSTTYDLISTYGGVGEDFDNHSESNATIAISYTVGIFEAIDITSVFTSLAAGDFCGVGVTVDGGANNWNVHGIRLRYK